MLLNLLHGQRDSIRTQAMDRAFKSGRKSPLGSARYGDNGLKIRPDLNRIGCGLFLRDVLPDSSRKTIQSPPSKSKPLPKKVFQHQKENFLRRMAKGQIQEDFFQQQHWKPSGKSILKPDH